MFMEVLVSRSVGAAVFSILATAAAFAGAGQGPIVYPHFVVGGGFEGVLLLSNSGDQAWNGQLAVQGFGAGSGIAWTVDGQDRTGTNSLDVTLPPLGTRKLIFSAPEGSQAAAGALEINPSGGSSISDLATNYFYNYSLNGELVDSIGVAAANPGLELVLPVEWSPEARIDTGVAIRVSQGTATPDFRFLLYDNLGRLVGEASGALGARFFSEIFPFVPEGGERFTGSLRVESEQPLYVTALRQRLLQGDRFQLTGVPPLILPQPASPPASFSARYQVTFDALWSAAAHPDDFPASAHFSGLIGGTHNGQVSFWKVGEPATDGIRNMAERGSKNPLSNEVRQAIDEGTAGEVISGGGIPSSPGTAGASFQANQDFPFVMLVSMIAPSPDWFVGVTSLNLFQDGDWVDEVSVGLFPYDAGTDSGTSYTSPNQATVPPQPISRITGAPFLVNSGVPSLGTFTFRLVDQ